MGMGMSIADGTSRSGTSSEVEFGRRKKGAQVLDGRGMGEESEEWSRALRAGEYQRGSGFRNGRIARMFDRSSEGLHRLRRWANSGIGLEISVEGRESSGREGSWGCSEMSGGVGR